MTDFMLYLLETAACLALFYFGYLLFLRKETYFHLNRYYLVLSIIASMVIPAFKITSPFLTVKAAEAMFPYSVTVTPVKTWGVEEVLLLVYTAGAGLFLARFIYHMIKLNFIIKKYGARKINGLKIVSVDQDFSPFSFLNFLFINDRKITENNMRRIIAHEYIHIKQHHSMDILLIEMVTILQWFNPFVWPYKKSLQETHEFLADYGVIAQGFSTAKYQLLMFEQHVGLKLFEFANSFKQSQIKRRITMMSKIKSRGAAKLKLLLVLPLAMLLVLAFAEPRQAGSQVTEVLDAGMTGIDIDNDVTTLNPGQDEEVRKQKQAEVEKELKMLILKEKTLRTELETTKDAEKRAQIKSNLAEVLKRKEKMEVYLEDGHLPPPSVPPESDLVQKEYQSLLKKEEALKTKLESVKDAGEKEELKASLNNVSTRRKEIEAFLETDREVSVPAAQLEPAPVPAQLEKEYKMLDEKADAIRAKLEETKDAEKRSELKNLLVEVGAKQKAIKIQLAESKTFNGADGLNLEKLEKELLHLSEKEAEIKKMLAESTDQEEKAGLKQNLKNVQETMALLKAKAGSLKK